MICNLNAYKCVDVVVYFHCFTEGLKSLLLEPTTNKYKRCYRGIVFNRFRNCSSTYYSNNNNKEEEEEEEEVLVVDNIRIMDKRCCCKQSTIALLFMYGGCIKP